MRVGGRSSPPVQVPLEDCPLSEWQGCLAWEFINMWVQSSTVGGMMRCMLLQTFVILDVITDTETRHKLQQGRWGEGCALLMT
jgi:hypothetical protein